MTQDDDLDIHSRLWRVRRMSEKMVKHHARQITLLLGTVCIALLCASSAFGQLAYAPEGCTREATANSVWNFKAVWTNAQGAWPMYLPWEESESLQPNPGSTKYVFFSQERAVQDAPPEHDASEPEHRLGIILGEAFGGDPTEFSPDYNATPYSVDPAPALGDAPWDALAFDSLTTGATYLPTIVADQNTLRRYKQLFIPRHTLKFTGPGPGSTEEAPTTATATVYVPPVLVTIYPPASAPTVNFSPDGEMPYPFVTLRSATDAFCMRHIEEVDAEGNAVQTIDDMCAEPVWASTLAAAAGPIYVTVLGEGLAVDNPNIPETMYPSAIRAYLDYQVTGQSNLNITRVTLNNSEGVDSEGNPLPEDDVPLSRAYTDYLIPAINSLDGSVKLKINPGILQLDPNRTDPNYADPRDPESPGINNPIISVFLTNPAQNMFVPGKYTDSNGYGEITIEPEKLPATGIPDWTMVTVRVSSFAVDGVWVQQADNPSSTMPKRINYLRTREWMGGVISGDWSGTDTTAYRVTPEIAPNTARMQTVTDIFLPQMMGGVVVDATHVTPANASRIGTVLGVFALERQFGTASVDRMYVTPANPSEIAFVSAVYGRAVMSGTPVDSKHVSPQFPEKIHKIIGVRIGTGPNLYNPDQHPWTEGDTAITLGDDPEQIIPGGVPVVTVEYETTSLFDPENAAAAWAGSRIALAAPMPEDTLDPAAVVIYGKEIGLNGVNYYSSTTVATAFQAGDSRITLSQPLPSSVTDVRILYGTDGVLETRSEMPTDPDHVQLVPSEIWRIGRVRGAYAILDQDGLAVDGQIAQQTGVVDTSDPTRMRVIPQQPEAIAQVLRVYDASNKDYYGPANPLHPFAPGDETITLDKAVPANISAVTIRYNSVSTAVAPNEPGRIRRVMGVFTTGEMGGTRIDDNTIEPEQSLSIRSVSAAYAIANQQGVLDPADTTKLTLMPAAGDFSMINKVFAVYYDEVITKDSVSLFDPNNPETVFRPGDDRIKLSVAPPEGVTTLTIHYETVNLEPTSFDMENRRVTISKPLPTSVPALDSSFEINEHGHSPIRLVYVSSFNYYNPTNPANPYNGGAQIGLDTPLPYGTVNIVVQYVENWNRYDVSNPTYVPGMDYVKLAEALPISSDGALVEYTAHLFTSDYNPAIYDPFDPDRSAASLRPFIPGDSVIRLNKQMNPETSAVEELDIRFRQPGALRLCISYQSDKKVRMGTYTTDGWVTLPVPLPDPSPLAPVVNYHARSRPLSTVTGPLSGDDTHPVIGTYTIGRPSSAYVYLFSHIGPDPVSDYQFVGQSGTLYYKGPRGLTSSTLTYRRQDPDAPGTGYLWVAVGGKYNGYVPLYYDRGSPVTGAIYRGAVSAGLNLSATKQQPSCSMNENTRLNTNRLIFDPRGNPMWFAPGFVALGDGSPRTIVDVTTVGWSYSNNSFQNGEARQNLIVHDSRPFGTGDMIDHGGISWSTPGPGRDYVGTYPVIGDPDPLVPEPADELSTDATRADDGSSSTQFVFRCRYYNRDGLAPQPWLHDADDEWNMYANQSSGVVLYLDEKGIGDYKPHFMKPEDAAVSGPNAMYIYRVIPKHGIGAIGNPAPYPWNHLEDTYRSLGIGTYHYFFGCSDDLLRFDPDLGRELFVFDYQPDPTEWGDIPLDPSTERVVSTYEEINRPKNRSYSSNGDLYDSTIYVDRNVLVPGAFGHAYPLDANFHPRVTCELRMPDFDSLNVSYYDAKYGYGRFYGTVNPYTRAVNPLIKQGASTVPNDPIYYGHLALAETCGARTKDQMTFRILYRQIDNKPPIEIKLFINNASFKSSGTATPPTEYKYTAYTMRPAADQGDPTTFAARGLYRTGVWYELPMQLPAGPHTYYFQANDGEHVVRYPVRPDSYPYGGGTYMDGWVPTGSQASERGTPGYIDNDYFPGPYVNNPSVLSEASVTPGTGREGEAFKYRVKYSDPDGQRPYSAFIYIETNSRGDVRKLAMQPEKPFFDPSADHSQEIINGIYYVLDTGTIKDLALENGLRRFYFEFTDDWGAYYDLNDAIPGELTRYPQGAGNWIEGPRISSNNPPTLYQGSVESQDGTANAATLWTYRVTYRDIDNDAPKFIKVYLGLLEPDGRTVTWDEGHTLQPAHPSSLYSSGVEYFFQTRLGAADVTGLNESKQYFYAFEAYDGTDWATYNSSSADDTRSNAAGCMILDPLHFVDPTHFTIRPLIAQQATVNSSTQVTPDNPGDVLKVWGVYATENLGAGGTNYLNAGDDPPFYSGGAITLTTPLSGSLAKVWIQYESQAPIVGPLPIDLPAPSGVIPDALIYSDYTNNPTPILIDDQKNGWINTDPNEPDDRGVLRMRGVAVFEGQPSVKYVTPDSPRDIASVEGVYLDPEMTGTNYYDPSTLEPPMTRTGVPDPDDPNRRTVIPDDPEKIAFVTGVYNAANPTGTNYFMGVNYPSTDNSKLAWQEALVIGDGTVWPKDPNNIVNIKGIYLTQSASGANYYRADGRAAQTCVAYDYLANPVTPADIKTVLGIYLTQDNTGTNYYNYSLAAAHLYGVSPSLPLDVTTVYINYIAQDDTEKWQGASLRVASVIPNDPRPIKTVVGVYKTYQYDATGKPAGTGTNYAINTTYTNGGVAIPLTESVPISALPADRSMAVVYDALPFGFGPYHEYLAASRDVSNYIGSSLWIGYYPRGKVELSNNNKQVIRLTDDLPLGVTNVNISCIAKAYSCGDSIIPLTTDLPEGTRTVWIKYSDIRFTHQLRGQAEQPLREDVWAQGTTFYSPDGWNASSSETLWTTALVIDPLTVVPPVGNAINTVQGVYLTQDTSGVDYYINTTKDFVEGDAVIRLATAIPAGVSQVWVNYSPRNVYIRDNHLDETGLLSDVTSGVVGVWLNSSRDGVNYYNPRLGKRHDADIKHLRLTTLREDGKPGVPDGTGYVWGRYYQRGDYHLDRWNRDVMFLPGKEKTETDKLVASYFFGTKMPQVLVANNPPTLLAGRVNKIRGSRSDQYIYTVTYRDTDGPNGQAPDYVRVYVDGQPIEMTASIQGGTPSYREGAVYTASPSGLSGGSHKFYFEASDGAAVAIYDWYTENNQDRPVSGDTVLDIDGPWVNNPPTLTDQLVTPNPVAGINPWDSVDYLVTYTDPDNDEPYFYDAVRDVNDIDSNANGIPDGQEYSGAPRVWIDGSTIDQYFTGTVYALEDDPMEPGKKRTIVAQGTPGWIPDQFAGKLLQITNGALAGRVYLIQSNTDSALFIATDDLATDGVKTATDPAASQFRINGLLMFKENATQQDFTNGVRYKLTVPKLAVGDHKFHITARSRENKPQWLIAKVAVAERVPYSVQVRAPASGDTPGPKVVANPPEGNVAPVLSNTLSTSLYAGPLAQIAAPTNLTTIGAFDAAKFATIRELRGVFLNANDFVLTAVADDATKNYYDPATASPVFAPGNTSIALTTSLPAVPPASMVQFGTVDAATLKTVMPDVKGVIDSVDGVYLTSDTTLAGTNYFGATGDFNATTGAITLGQALPSGTKSVLISYTVKAGLTWTSTPVAVPVYLKYFAATQTTTAGVPVFQASDLVTFRANYSDANNDPPSYHDGVQGYVRVVFTDVNFGKTMHFLDTLASVDYTSPVLFTTEPVNPPEGTHKYHFEASDGYVVTRWPASSASDYTIKVNYKPVLSSGRVDPTSGQSATNFQFTVNYKDQDGPGANTPQAYLRISKLDGSMAYVRMPMELKSTTPSYTQGVTYGLTLVPDDVNPPLEAGQYVAVFEATDGDGQDAIPYPAPDGTTQLTFTIRDTNTRPVLSDLQVTPAAGKLNTLFVYKAVYKDADGDAPIGQVVHVGQKDELTLVIDKGLPTQLTVAMSKASTAPANPTADDYKNGVLYQSTAVSGKTLGAGHHTYEVQASDGTDNAVAVSAAGPALLIPYFENFRPVDADLSPAAQKVAAAVTYSDVGGEVVFVGLMKFPYSTAVQTPAEITNLAITVTKPDGTTLSLKGSTSNMREDYSSTQVRLGWVADVTASYPIGVDPALATGDSLTLTASGTWKAHIAWAGDGTWDKATTEGTPVQVVVSGPKRTIAVADPNAPATSSPLVDMITPPRIIGSSDVGQIFGTDLALDMQIVRWDPSVGTGMYFRYGATSGFPALQPGQAIWIKPKVTYPAEAVSASQVSDGFLSLGNPEAAFNEALDYRVLKPFVNDYKTLNTGAVAPCEILLQPGWNQFGTIFFNWRKDALGNPITPREDIGMPISELWVRNLATGETKTLAEAKTLNWIRDYAWRYDAVGRRYVMVHPSASGAERTIKAWAGYWIRSFVNCQLIINPTTTYNGTALAAASASKGGIKTMSMPKITLPEEFDMPPPIPD